MRSNAGSKVAMPPINLKRISIYFAFCGLHFGVWLIAFILTFTLGMDRFDTGDPNKGLLENLAAITVGILGLPLSFLITQQWLTTNIHAVFQWLIIAMNSMLWGAALTGFAEKLERSFQKRV